LADACGWTRGSRIGNYEQGTNEPNLRDLKKIARATGVNESWLVSEIGPRRGAEEASPDQASSESNPFEQIAQSRMAWLALARAMVRYAPALGGEFADNFRAMAREAGWPLTGDKFPALLSLALEQFPESQMPKAASRKTSK
jgi:transcriptional regulator with XRE-family HTH domain